MTNKTLRIAISGSSGQVGFAIEKTLKENTNYEVIGLSSKELDITDEQKLIQLFKSSKFDYFINAAAYTQVDRAEEEAEKAFAINGHALKNLASICATNDCHLIHFSSDYVYHSVTDRPILETDITTPKSIYAQSKLLGDNNVMLYSKAYTIIRTSWVYGPSGNNFVKTMVKLGKIKDNLKIVNDQIGSPTYSIDIAKVVLKLMQQKQQNPSLDITGIYNFSNDGKTNWLVFAKKIFEITNLSPKLEGITTEEYGAKAVRPKWSILSKSRIKSLINVRLNHWEESLFDYIKNYL